MKKRKIVAISDAKEHKMEIRESKMKTTSQQKGGRNCMACCEASIKWGVEGGEGLFAESDWERMSYIFTKIGNFWFGI